MSRHQAVRNLDYKVALDEYDGYSEEEDELSPEDRAAMTQGTIDVRAILGPASSKVTTAQIEEALWHYYYDIEKTVAYLVSKFVAPSPPAVKQQKASSSSNVDEYGSPVASKGMSPPSNSYYFRDMPWGNIPKHRETVFIPPTMPQGGLLGGSGAPPKMSKLQMLAAARKKKAEEKNAKENVEQTQAKMSELSVDEKPVSKENIPLSGGFSKRLKTSETTAAGRMPLADSERSRHEPADRTPLKVTEPSKPSVEPEEKPVVEKAPPSGFALTLFGPANAAKPTLREVFTLPNAGLSPSILEAFAKPSPDDVVLAAQAKVETAGKKVAPGPKKKGAASTDAITSEVKALKIEDPLPKSRNLNVLSEFEQSNKKKTASFVVVGHVDAGKSTMMGRLLLDLKVVDQRTVEKLRQEADKIGKSSFALAWVLDQRVEERARGVTIDIATNRFETANTAFTILDAPGHRDFIPNMIAGASQADFAILVIDSATGAFESGLKGQTREHALLIRSMGVARIIVAVNKLDTVNWAQDRFDEIKHQISGFLTGTGFQLKNVAFVPVSGLNGDNLVNKSTDPAAAWYTGPTLVEELENSEPIARALSKPFRLTIADLFRSQQSPVTISGRIDAGSVQVGDAVLVQPSGEKAYVKSLMVNEEPADWAVAGHSVTIHLSGIDPVHVRLGDIVCDPSKPIQCLDTFKIKALAFDFIWPTPLDVHRGRLHAPGKIQSLDALLDKVTGAVTKKKPQIVKPGSVARLTVKLDKKEPLEAGMRIILRMNGETLAAGLLE
ncbi:HBS1-like protein [Rhypophila sp. PSN 637]